MSKKNEISRRLREVMDNRKMSYSSLAQAVGMPYFKTRHFVLNPDVQAMPIMITLADALEVSVDWLIHGIGDPESDIDFIYRYQLSNLSLIHSRTTRTNIDDAIEIVVDTKTIYPIDSVLTLQKIPHPQAIFKQNNNIGIVGELIANKIRLFDGFLSDHPLEPVGFISRILFPPALK